MTLTDSEPTANAKVTGLEKLLNKKITMNLVIPWLTVYDWRFGSFRLSRVHIFSRAIKFVIAEMVDKLGNKTEHYFMNDVSEYFVYI